MAALSDPISDFLTRFKNATRAGKEEFSAPFSKIKADIARILKEEGYIWSYEVDNEDQIDLHTVLIGSGPAFFYDLMQEFEKRLDELLSDKESKRLVSIVFLSSIINAIKNGENLEELVESVA